MSLYIGFDSSTQSLSAIAIEVGDDGERRVVFERSLRFDEDFPDYGTKNGVLPDDDPLVAHSSPLLWVEALDCMMGIVATESGLDLTQLKAISGSGQQHGSVYLGSEAERVLGSLDPRRELVEQIAPALSRSTSPIWMDSSTFRQCREIAAAVGGDAKLAEISGSRAFERFTGPQIRKLFQEEPEAYHQTRMIHLVSSFLATLLAGRHAPIDPGDGAGMNLMDLERMTWSPAALEATAPDLGTKLPPLANSRNIVGSLAPYWVERYGFPAEVNVGAWSGDNPCSLIGVGLVRRGRLAISLGTSDTLFGFMPELHVDPTGQGHVFGSPTGHFMSLICFKNGSLARERVRAAGGYSWDGFSEALRETPAGNHGRVLLPWFEPEITPHVAEPGEHRYRLDPSDSAANVRAVVEAQMLSMSIHSEWMKVEVDTIYATGGAARNREILQVLSDVHDAEVFQLEVGNSACLGAALRAFHAAEVGRGADTSWEEITRGFVEPRADSRMVPDRSKVELYRDLKSIYRACEQHAQGIGEDPELRLKEFQERYARR